MLRKQILPKSTTERAPYFFSLANPEHGNAQMQYTTLKQQVANKLITNFDKCGLHL